MILQRYILKSILLHLLFIISILIGVFLLIAYFHFVQEVAAAKLTSSDIAKLIVTEIPVLLQPITPLSFFLSILLVLHHLYASHEVLGMYASGFSTARMFGPIMALGLVLAIFSAYLQFYIFPIANATRIHILEDAMHNVSLDKLFAKQFNQLTSEEVIYVENKIKSNNKLEGIFYSRLTPDKDNRFSYDIIVAKYLEEMILPDKSKFIVFTNGKHYISKLSKGSESTIIKFETFAIRTTPSDYRLENWPGCMSTKELYQMSKTNRYAAAELHWRISIPFSVLNLTLFAVAFNKNRILGYANTITYFYPIFIYIIYVNLLLIGMSLIKNGVISKQIGLWFIHGLMFLLSIFTMRYKLQ